MKVLELLLILNVLVSFTGCNLFKRTTKSTEQTKLQSELERNVQLNADAAKKSEASLLTFSKDSSWNAYTIRLWPGGIVKYSPDAGFEGLFDSVLVTGNSRKSAISDSYFSQKNDEKSQLKISDQQHEQLKSTSKLRAVKHAPDILLIGVILLVITLVIIYLLKRYFR